MATTTINLEEDELRKVKGAMWDMYDKHRGDGNREVAKEYKDLFDKIVDAEDD